MILVENIYFEKSALIASLEILKKHAYCLDFSLARIFFVKSTYIDLISSEKYFIFNTSQPLRKKKIKKMGFLSFFFVF